jgi:hypothetical protein
MVFEASEPGVEYSVALPYGAGEVVNVWSIGLDPSYVPDPAVAQAFDVRSSLLRPSI